MLRAEKASLKVDSKDHLKAGCDIMARSLVCLGQMVLLLSVLVHSSTSLPTLERRVQRHADGLINHILMMARNEAAVKHVLNALLNSKRSVSESAFSNDLMESDPNLEEMCFNGLYQSFLNERYRSYKMCKQ
ncbi:hypothetical protein XENTR_v10011085 [Xenopus tropicalis]|nr:hypothetical protein XENTR_v10011085 [Xenopus tropicalis]